MKVLTLKINDKTYTTGKITAYQAKEAIKINKEAIKLARMGTNLDAESTDIDLAEEIFTQLEELGNRKANLICSVYIDKFDQDELEKSRDKDKMIFHQSKLAAMGEMIENITHQWRQPLSQVNSAVLIIDDTLEEKGIKNEVIEEKLLEIESLTKYMSNTINDFKNFFDENKIKYDFIIEDILDKAIEVLDTKLKANDIKILSGIKTEHKCFTYPNELQQVFLIILNNAIDAIQTNNKKSSKIKIEVEKIDNYNYIRICDNAGGMSKEIEDKIFEPYYTTKHKTQGTGLGLYIAKIIIEDSLGGELSLQNKSTGVCFIIKLKVEDGQ